MNVINFRSKTLRKENAMRAAEIERALKAPRELTAEDLRLIRMVAWEKFLLATKAMVAAQDAMNEAHKTWLESDLRMFAANAAEKIGG